MNMETLKLFRDVAALKSISKAARKSHLTQSALSQQLKSWENMLGTELLSRSNKGAELTEAGSIVDKYALQICKLYDDMMTEIQQLQSVRRQLSIYAISEVCSYALPCTLYEIKRQFPDCRITLNEGSSPNIEEHLLLEEGDIGFISGPSSKTELSSHKVFSDKVMLVAGQNILCPDKITIADLPRYPLIWFAHHRAVECAMQSMLEETPKLNVLYNLESIEAVKMAAIKGHGMAFLPYMAIKKELYGKQLRIVHIDNFQVYNDIYMVKKKNQRCDDGIKQLLRSMEQMLVDTLC